MTYKALQARIGVLFISVLLFTGVVAQKSFVVDASRILNDVHANSVGININYLTDGTYAAPQASTTDALKGMGVKFLRYPGGEKADNYLWSEAPWARSAPKFARIGNCEWPSSDMRFAQNDYATPQASVLDFDEFMQMCRSVGGEPLIVVAYDAIFKKIAPGCSGSIPTKEQLLVNAEEWVRYANLVKGYHIKYWMIGNESYNDSYNGMATATQYRDDIIEFAKRMKAVDPGIKIIVNGDKDSWWGAVLPGASAWIDFLGVSNYPVWNYTGGYDYYRNNTPELMDVVKTAIKAINSYCPPADRARIKVITTEFNAHDWSGSWSGVNDLGHALAAFEIMGEHLKTPEVEAALMWNTRWVNTATKPRDIFDAIDKEGRQEPSGMALAAWGNNLLDQMVYCQSSTSIRSFASYRRSSQELTLYIINKELSAQSVSMALQNYLPSAEGERWELSGTGPDDQYPAWQRKGAVNAVKGTLALDLPPVSITVVKLKPVPVITAVTAATSFHDINLYPNPARDQLNIRFATNPLQPVKLRVISVDGRECYNATWTVSDKQIELYTGGWARGTYILQTDDGSEKINRKFVLQ